MPLPKLPTKPAALLSPRDYPKADKDKIVKSLTLIEPVARKTEAAPAPAPVRAKIADKAPATKPRAASSAQTVALAPKSGTRRPTDKSGVTKLFVLDTNVLMHCLLYTSPSPRD